MLRPQARWPGVPGPAQPPPAPHDRQGSRVWMNFKEPPEALTVKVRVSTVGRHQSPAWAPSPVSWTPLEPTAFRRAVWWDTHPGTEPTACLTDGCDSLWGIVLGLLEPGLLPWVQPVEADSGVGDGVEVRKEEGARPPVILLVNWSLYCCCCSVAKSRLTFWDPMDCSTPVLDCPSLSQEVCSNSRLLSRWCHPTISSSVTASPPALNLSQDQGLFWWVFTSGGRSIGASISATVLPGNIQDWFPLSNSHICTWQLEKP